MEEKPDINLQTDYSNSETNRSVTISIIASIGVHILVVLFIMVQENTCSDCNETDAMQQFSPPLNVYLHPKIALKPIADNEDSTLPEVEIITAETAPEIIKDISTTVAEESDRAEQKVKIAGKLKYFNIKKSITELVTKEGLKIQEAWLNECEQLKKFTGQADCIPAEERFGLKSKDPYKLAQIFRVLDTSISDVKSNRIIKKLLADESRTLAVIQNMNIDENIREEFRTELAFLRSELHYRDCGSSPDSGVCAGELDLMKLGGLLNKIFNNLQ